MRLVSLVIVFCITSAFSFDARAELTLCNPNDYGARLARMSVSLNEQTLYVAGYEYVAAGECVQVTYGNTYIGGTHYFAFFEGFLPDNELKNFVWPPVGPKPAYDRLCVPLYQGFPPRSRGRWDSPDPIFSIGHDTEDIYTEDKKLKGCGEYEVAASVSFGIYSKGEGTVYLPKTPHPSSKYLGIVPEGGLPVVDACGVKDRKGRCVPSFTKENVGKQ